MSGYTFAWILWVAMFAVIEGTALFNKNSGDTLSEHVWEWFSVKEKGKGWRARRTVLLGGLAWLLVHFMSGGELI